jgi:hypothetical protein
MSLAAFVDAVTGLIMARKSERNRADLEHVLSYQQAVTQGYQMAAGMADVFSFLLSHIERVLDDAGKKQVLATQLTVYVSNLGSAIANEAEKLQLVNALLRELPSESVDKAALAKFSTSTVTVELNLMRIAAVVCSALFSNDTEALQQACNDFATEIHNIDFLQRTSLTELRATIEKCRLAVDLFPDVCVIRTLLENAMALASDISKSFLYLSC